MSEGGNPDTGKQFAQDLRRIRESRDIPLQAIHEETKIPLNLIVAFEVSGLFNHPMFNRVYLRSFVRTYAEVVGLNIEKALAALDEALEGRYDGSLLRTPESEEEVAPAETPSVEEEEMAAAVAVPDTTEQEPLPPLPEPEPEQEEEPEPAVVAAPPAERKPAAERERPVYQAQPEPSAPWGRWIGIAVAVIVAVGLIWFFLGRDRGDQGVRTVADEQTTIAPVDTNQAPAPAPQPVAIGDTIEVTIIAARGPVQDIKVRVDDDVRRPYWIEEGESRVFTATDQMFIERQLEKVDLLLEGRPFPTDSVDEQGRIVITRASAEAFLSR